jgi:hypothetical protein
MALIFNLKGGTVRSTKRVLPNAFSDGKRIRSIGQTTTYTECDNSVCHGEIGGPSTPKDACVFEVACDTPPSP